MLYQSYTDNHEKEIQGKKEFENEYNHARRVYVSMSNTKRSDDTSIHCIPFRGFLKGDARFLLFSVFMHENLLMSDIKSDPYANLSWIMPRTHEYFNLKGRFYIASAPIQITRFPPPKITKENASGYWEQERLRQWSLLDHQLRATFTWPSKTEVIDNKSLLCQSLPYDKSCLLIDIAMDNFCLLVYKVTEAEYLDYSIFPPKRMVCPHKKKTTLFISSLVGLFLFYQDKFMEYDCVQLLIYIVNKNALTFLLLVEIEFNSGTN